MNAKSTSLFFILFVLASSTNSPAKEAPQSQVHSGHTFSSILTDLTISDDVAVNQVTSSIKDYLSADFQFDNQLPSKQLSSLLSYKNYINDVVHTSDIDVAKETKAILASIPDFDSLSSQFNQDFQKVKDASLRSFNDASEKFLETLRLANLHEWFVQLKKDSTKFDLVRYKELSQDFLKQYNAKVQSMVNKLVQNKQKGFSQEFKDVFDKLKSNTMTFYSHIGRYVKDLTHVYKNSNTFLKDTAISLFEKVVSAYSGTIDLTDFKHSVLPVIKTRLTLIVHAMADLTNSDDAKDDLNLIALFEDISYYVGNVPEAEVLSKNAEFQSFATDITQLILDSMVAALPAAEVTRRATDFLLNEVVVFESNPGFLKAINDNFKTSQVRAALPNNDETEVIQKIKNFDYLVDASANISDERYRILIHNVGVINSVNKNRLNFAQKLKIIHNYPGLDNTLFPLFLSDLYEAITYCAATTPEADLNGNEHELFDKCINIAKQDTQTHPWAENHYIAFKLLNLCYTPETSAYQTTFLPLSADDKNVKNLFLFDSVSGKFGKSVRQTYLKISKDTTDENLSNGNYITFYSGKTLPAASFHTANKRTEVTEDQRERINTTGNKIEINYVNDKLKTQNPLLPRLDGQTGNTGNSIAPQRDVQTVKVHYDDGFSGEMYESIEMDNRPRIKKGQATNYVNPVVGKVPADILHKLTTMKFNDFVSSIDPIETVENVEYTNVVIKVTRRQNPCYDSDTRKC